MSGTRPIIIWRANLFLLLAAAIWGFGFAAQREGMKDATPMAFNAARHLVGFAVLAPFVFLRKPKARLPVDGTSGSAWRAGLFAGTAMFAGAAFQQMGLVHTTAGSAAFVTGLYVVIVPLLALFWGKRPPKSLWFASGLAFVGLYLLSGAQGLALQKGDFLVFLGAFAWAAHVLIIGAFSGKVDVMRLAATQLLVCAILSAIAAAFMETIDWAGLWRARGPILYLGVFSIGLGFTFQILGQRRANATAAAIIMSLESVFGALAGWIWLGEILDSKGLIGCALMLIGMTLAQFPAPLRKRGAKAEGQRA